MRVSLHRRRHESLPPEPRRSPRVLIVVMVLGSAGVGLAAANLGDDGAAAAASARAFDPAVASAEQASHDVVDERIRAHLRRLR